MLYLATNQATNSIEVRGDYKIRTFDDAEKEIAYVNYERVTDTWAHNLCPAPIFSRLVNFAGRYMDSHQYDIVHDINRIQSVIEDWYREPSEISREWFIGFDTTGTHCYPSREALYESENAFSIRRFMKLVGVILEAQKDKALELYGGYTISIALHVLD